MITHGYQWQSKMSKIFKVIIYEVKKSKEIRYPATCMCMLSYSLVHNSLRPHESQHARPPCPSPIPGVHSLTSIKSVMPSSHLIFCRPLLLLLPFPPRIRVFTNESTLRMRWPKYWSFSFSIIPSKEIPGLISFRMDWLDLLATAEASLGEF